MNVYIVLETYPEYDLVDNDLNVLGFDVGIIKGVYGTYQAAIRNALKLQAIDDKFVAECGCDPVKYIVAEWEVNQSGE